MHSLIIKYSIALFLLITFILSTNINAQNYGKLRGFVSDSTNGEVLPYCNAYIEELDIGASTDVRGQFFISNSAFHCSF